MLRFSSFELQRNVAKIQDAAMREPVEISNHGHDSLVMLPVGEFERLKRRDKMVISMEYLPEEFITALGKPYYTPEQAALDNLADD